MKGLCPLWLFGRDTQLTVFVVHGRGCLTHISQSPYTNAAPHTQPEWGGSNSGHIVQVMYVAPSSVSARGTAFFPALQETLAVGCVQPF